MQGRVAHDLDLDVAMLERENAADALTKAVTAHTAVNKTRMRLARWPERLGVEGYGTSCPCSNPGVIAVRSFV